jgi:hypothetical protein
MMFNISVLEKILGTTGEDMIGRCRKLHFIRATTTLVGHVPSMWERNTHRFLLAKPGQKI